jgi:hypothetical protein
MKTVVYRKSGVYIRETDLSELRLGVSGYSGLIKGFGISGKAGSSGSGIPGKRGLSSQPYDDDDCEETNYEEWKEE